MLLHEYELFEMKETETINGMHGRLADIITALRNLGHTINLESKNGKMIRSLFESWDSKRMQL